MVVSLALTHFLKTPVIYEGASAKPLKCLAAMLQVAFTETDAYSFTIHGELPEIASVCV